MNGDWGRGGRPIPPPTHEYRQNQVYVVVLQSLRPRNVERIATADENEKKFNGQDIPYLINFHDYCQDHLKRKYKKRSRLPF